MSELSARWFAISLAVLLVGCSGVSDAEQSAIEVERDSLRVQVEQLQSDLEAARADVSATAPPPEPRLEKIHLLSTLQVGFYGYAFDEADRSAMDLDSLRGHDDTTLEQFADRLETAESDSDQLRIVRELLVYLSTSIQSVSG